MPRIALFDCWASPGRNLLLGLCSVAFLASGALAQVPQATIGVLNDSTSASPRWFIEQPVRFFTTGTVNKTIYIKDPSSNVVTGSRTIVPGTGLLMSGSYFPSAAYLWTGLASDGVAVNASPYQMPGKVQIQWGFSAGSYPYTYARLMPLNPGRITYVFNSGSTATPRVILPEITITIAADNTAVIVDPQEPGAGYNPLAILEGQTLSIPFVGSKGKNIMKVGGVEYEVYGDDMGAGMARIEIPANWDGSVEFNGQKAFVASSMGMEGPGPTIIGTLIGNLYSEALPQGMIRWDSNTDLPLPPGMTLGTRLDLPSGMTVAPVPNVVGDKVYISPLIAGSSRNYAYDLDKFEITPPTGGTGTAGSGVNSPAVSGLTDGEAMAWGAAQSNNAAGAESAGKAAGDPGPSIGEKMALIRSKVNQLMPTGSIISGGSLPRTNTMPINWNFGKFGVINNQIDFGSPPWTYLRVAILVCFTFSIGVAIMRRLTI